MFKNKTIIISGSNGLIGKKLKEYFISEGANVIGLDLKKLTTLQLNVILQMKLL